MISLPYGDVDVGPPLDATFKISHVLFHWGANNNQGSEHTLDGKRLVRNSVQVYDFVLEFRFPLEMQMVYKNVSHKVPLALSFFFEVIFLFINTKSLFQMVAHNNLTIFNSINILPRETLDKAIRNYRPPSFKILFFLLEMRNTNVT